MKNAQEGKLKINGSFSPFGKIEFVVNKDSVRPLAQSGFGNLGGILLVGAFEVWIQMFISHFIVFFFSSSSVNQFFKLSQLNYSAFYG